MNVPLKLTKDSKPIDMSDWPLDLGDLEGLIWGAVNAVLRERFEDAEFGPVAMIESLGSPGEILINLPLGTYSDDDDPWWSFSLVELIEREIDDSRVGPVYHEDAEHFKKWAEILAGLAEKVSRFVETHAHKE